MALKLCLPLKPHEIGGGGFRFLSMFEHYLDQHHIAWTRSLWEHADVLFVNSWQTSPWWVALWRFLHPQGVVVHRVDNSASNYGRSDAKWADARLRNVNKYAKLTIYQSSYARNQVNPVPAYPQGLYGRHYAIIHNPVDTSVFHPKTFLPDRMGFKARVAVVSWSTNELKGAREVADITVANPDVQFVLIGRFHIIKHTQAKNVKALGILDMKGVARALRDCDAMLTMSQREACPNHVLEGLASGLPILYVDSGATHELVGDAGIAIDRDTCRPALDKVLNLPARIKARERALDFSTDRILPKYLAEIRSVMG